MQINVDNHGENHSKGGKRDIRGVDGETKGVQRVVVVDRRSAKEDKGQKQEIQGAHGLHVGGGYDA